jgi:hypothetical protein
MNTAALDDRHRASLRAAVDCAFEHAGGRLDASLPHVLYSQWFTRIDRPKPSAWDGPWPFLTRLRQAWTHATVVGHSGTVAQAIAHQRADASTGYWAAWSAVGPAADAGAVRIYWNALQQGAPLLLHTVALVLPPSVPWSLKIPLASADYQRCDTVVVYLAPRAWPALRAPLRRVAREMAGSLVDQVPPLTLPIAAGASVAVDPGVPGESFGMGVCRRLSAMIGQAAAAGATRQEVSDALVARLSLPLAMDDRKNV